MKMLKFLTEIKENIPGKNLAPVRRKRGVRLAGLASVAALLAAPALAQPRLDVTSFTNNGNSTVQSTGYTFDPGYSYFPASVSAYQTAHGMYATPASGNILSGSVVYRKNGVDDGCLFQTTIVYTGSSYIYVKDAYAYPSGAANCTYTVDSWNSSTGALKAHWEISGY